MRGAALAVIAALLCVPLRPDYAFWDSTVIYEGESVYNYLQVREDSRFRYFSTNVLFGVQSMLPHGYLDDPDLAAGVFYYDGLFAVCGFLPHFEPDKPIDSLLLGLGTGTYAMLLQQILPGSRCVGVEIDPGIVSLARDYFGLTEQACEAVVADGRSYVQTHDELFDLIIVDAYQDITIPFHMATTEFFSLCKSRLKPGGVIVCNINMGTSENNAVSDAIVNTLSSQFEKIYAYDEPSSSNTLLFATNDGDLKLLQANLQKASSNPTLYKMMSHVAPGLDGPLPATGPALTDDRAPAELLAASVLQNLIADERAAIDRQVQSYGGGLKGWWRYFQEMMG